MKALLNRLRRDRRASVAILTAGILTGAAGLTALSVDLGNIARAQRQLQNTADLAALAGAANIANGTAISVATTYSAVANDKNAGSGVTATMATGYPQLKCFTSTGVPCGGSSAANAIVVQQKATVQLYFAPLFGINTASIAATSTAGSGGGKPNALDVMLVLDTTQSMNSSDNQCSISHATREDCALAGVRSLIQGFWPSQDHVGLMVFPGVKQGQTQTGTRGRGRGGTGTGSQTPPEALEYDCSSSPQSTIAAYDESPIYEIVPLSSDYKTSDTTTTLNTASNLVKAARGGGSGCSQGLDAIGGVGTYYADAITAAQTELTTNGRSGVQKVIILLSDGDASSSDISSSKRYDQCQAAVNAATTATNAGTWVYSIAYGASTSSSGSCSTDTPHISACNAMKNIASDSTKFYSDNSGGTGGCNSDNSASELVDIFNHVGSSVTMPRLLPNGTT
ncbi:MAG TPA: pilus assembly protein TadG-related protein [Stellaceae bacterium]|nr:pilus assembly protein TadG-related protein [Stellaceae bacterium]